MAVKAYISTTEINKALKSIDIKNDDIRENIVNELNKTGANVESQAKIKAPVNDGLLRASIQSAYATMQDLMVTIKAGGATTGGLVNYAPYVEFGTKKKVRVPAGYQQLASQYKGGTGKKFADLQRAIARWANKKGIAEEAVFPIAMSIARHGIPAQPFLIPAFEGEKNKLVQRLKKVAK
jgi:HK97 gp10 family phage protein